MSTVSLGPTMPMLTVELTRNRPWRSRKGVGLRSQSGTPMQWPAAPQLVFSNGTTVGFALSSDSLLAVPATALSAAQVDEIIDSGSAIISLIDPGSGVPWAHGRYSVHYGAGTGGSGLISTSGESVVIIADRIEVIGGGGGGLTQSQVEEVARDAVGAALVAGAGITITPDDGADTITITSTGGGSVADATTTSKGVVQLAGDLAGTAAAPTVPGLAGKANTSHTHAAADIGSGTLAIARIPTGTTSSTVALGNHAHSGYATSTHNHDSTYVKPADVQATPQAINAQTGTTYTLVASDAGKLVTLTNAAAITLTVPGSVFTTGQRVDCLVLGAGMVTVTGDGATVNGTPSLVSRAQYSAFSVVLTSASSAVIVGDLA